MALRTSAGHSHTVPLEVIEDPHACLQREGHQIRAQNDELGPIRHKPFATTLFTWPLPG